jgi:hypothetical protein
MSPTSPVVSMASTSSMVSLLDGKQQLRWLARKEAIGFQN